MDDRVEPVRALALLGITGHQQDGELGKIPRGGERKRDSVHDRHADVGEQKVEAPRLAYQQLERVAAVARGRDLVAVACERARTERAERLLVFSYENARHGVGLSVPRP